MRKALQAEQGKADMEQRLKQLEAEKKDFERQIQVRGDCWECNTVSIVPMVTVPLSGLEI